MGVARAWSRSEMGKFLPSLSVNFIIYLQNVLSAMSLSLLVPEEKKLQISINFQKSVYPLYISALASAPSRPPNPTLTIQNQAFSNKQKSVQKSQKPKKPGVLTVNIIPISHKSAKIAIFSCQKSRVPNKI